MRSRGEAGPDTQAGLFAALREQTMEAHRQVERSPGAGLLMSGKIDQQAYLRFSCGLYRIYEQLESSLDAVPQGSLPSMLRQPKLRRTASLLADLAFFGLTREQAQRTAGPGAEAYRNHLAELAKSKPDLLFAHAYVRYFGDLSGGQMMVKVIARALGLNGPGLSFFRFDQIEDARAYRSVLVAEIELAWGERMDQTEIEAQVSEARTAFALSQGLMDDLVWVQAEAQTPKRPSIQEALSR